MRMSTGKSDPQVKTKKTRRAKRRPGNIIEFFGRSKPDKIWLETHLWHAKRFHMTTTWGFKLAERPNEKSERANARAAKYMSVMHDASYFRCVEVEGAYGDIVDALAGVMDPTTPGVGGNRYKKGERQGATFLHRPGSFPNGAICPITFHWHPNSDVDRTRKLWIWVHPSAFEEALECFVDVSNASEGKVSFKHIDSELSRFEFTGPRSHAVLTEVLKLGDADETPAARLWRDLELLRTPAALPPGVVIGLNVLDPRLRIQNHLISWPTSVAPSRLWSADERTKIIEGKPTDKQINSMREKELVPTGSLMPSFPTIPIILLQRRTAPTSVSDNMEHASGWDIVVPSSYGIVLWRAFVFAGARVGGLNERRQLHYEAGTPAFPYDFPETPAFTRWAESMGVEEKVKWERKPKAKRVNFRKLGVDEPFRSDFGKVLSGPEVGDESRDAFMADAVAPQEKEEKEEEKKPEEKATGKKTNPVVKAAESRAEERTEEKAQEKEDEEEKKEPVVVEPVIVLHSYQLVKSLSKGLAVGDAPADIASRLSDAMGAPFDETQLLSTFARIKITILGRGAPDDRGLVYMATHEEQEFWVESLKRNKSIKEEFDARDPSFPLDRIPPKSSIVGHITTGGYSLGAGKGTSIATVSVKGFLDIYATAKRFDSNISDD
ncbi:hypothetical protein HK101_010616 [Irineochytrium annulatum]|nr:hypothetical protein HK101_010616 [Irineochytrium annulatum]